MLRSLVHRQLPKVALRQNFLSTSSSRLSNIGGLLSPKLVIFDQHGTLIDLKSHWEPWVESLVTELENKTGKDLKVGIRDILGFTKDNEIGRGPITSGSMRVIERHVQHVLAEAEIPQEITEDVAHFDNDASALPTDIRSPTNVKALFKILAENSIKIAISTSDNRLATLSNMSHLGVSPYISAMTCGDDKHIMPKPNHQCIQYLCDDLAISRNDTLIVGDTMEDMAMGRMAGVTTCGVLSGSSSLSDLEPFCDFVVRTAGDILTFVLPEDSWISEVEKGVFDTTPDRPTEIVIFDKDGTLICFQSLWLPWAHKLVENVCSNSGKDLSRAIYEKLGVSVEKQRVLQGILAEGTTEMCKNAVRDVLIEAGGFSFDDADRIAEESWIDGKEMQSMETLKTIENLKRLFKRLRMYDIKVAVCTADNRTSTEETLRHFELLDYVDYICCSDDDGSAAKPNPQNALKICNHFGIPLHHAVVVGDTKADMGMGVNARVGRVVGVLSGVGAYTDLEPLADDIVDSVESVHKIILPGSFDKLTYPTKPVKQPAVM